MKKAYYIPIFVLVLGVFINPRPVFGYTNISGNISLNTVWQTGEVYVLDGPVSVDSGAKLTIEPGTIVKFKQWALLAVNGELVVNGTSTQEVYFTSFNDDSVDGDTNGDGPSSGSPGYWSQIQFNSGSVGSIKHAVIRYGGNGWEIDSNLYVTGGTVNISDSTIASSRIYGIQMIGGLTTIENSLIRNNRIGIYALGYGNLTFNNNQFIDNNDVAVHIQFAGYNGTTSSGNTSSGIGRNAILIHGTTLIDYTLNGGIPYIFDNVEVGADKTLTINQGAIIKFSQEGQLSINGTLNANGTVASPIYFTSLKDDSVGGDTNNYGGTPAAGDWNQIQFNSGSTGSINHSIIRYGGSGWEIDSNLFVAGGTVNIWDSTITSSAYYGIQKTGGSVSITNSTIADNAYGIYNSTLSTIDAKNNYWGDPSGPYHWWSNSTGLGNTVSNNVDFKPFLTSPPTGDSAKEPVIIVPGILGSYLNKVSNNEEVWPNMGKMTSVIDFSDSYLNDLKLDGNGDEILDMYPKGIIESVLSFTEYGSIVNKFNDDGYVLNKDLFIFSYDWRLDISNSYQNLDSVIAEAIVLSPTGKVNIIAHSMGGLLVKKYLSQPENSNLVDKVVFLGTPNIGAPKTYNMLNYGDDMDLKFLGLGLNPNKSKDISQNMPAVYELLPSREYINLAGGYIHDLRNGNKILNYDETTKLMISNPADTRNPTLIDLADKFHESLDYQYFSGPQIYNIIGCQNSETIGSYRLYPKNKFKIDPSNGDGTVPFISASNNTQNDSNFYVNSATVDHMGLVQSSDVLDLVKGIIQENVPTFPVTISSNQSDCINNTFKTIDFKLLFSSHSPVNLHLYDSQNRHTGLKSNGDLEVGIPGSDFFQIGDNSFIWAPQGDTYRVEIDAYATGSFDFDVNKYQGSNLEASINYLDVPIRFPQLKAELSIVDINDNPPLAIDLDGNGITDAIINSQGVLSVSDAQDILPPDIHIISPLSQSYERSVTLPLDIRIFDNQSGVAIEEVKIDDDIINSANVDLFSYSLGSHSLNVSAYDKAGNLSTKEVKFDIIATVNSTISDVNRSYDLDWIHSKKNRDSLLKKLQQINNPPRHYRGDPISQFQAEVEADYVKGLINSRAYGILKEDGIWLASH